jgi:hypothetical protein
MNWNRKKTKTKNKTKEGKTYGKEKPEIHWKYKNSR